MTGTNVFLSAIALAVALCSLSVQASGRDQAAAQAAKTSIAGWTENRWPFPLDQWGRGRAFTCSGDDCGGGIKLYLRAKLGFCNCTTGVADDAELDRIGDLELLSDKFEGLRDGRPISVAWMKGRSRPYQVAVPHALPHTVLAIAFNDRCDVVVATVIADDIIAAEHVALRFLNSELVLRWAEKELGL
jgi:hypothetical protein